MNELIPIVRKAKFLGVMVDAQLRWKDQVMLTVSKALPRVFDINRLSKALNGRQPELIKNLFNSLVISMFDYYAVCMCQASGQVWGLIEAFYHRALKILSGLSRKTSNELARRVCGVDTIRNRIQEQANRTFFRVNKTSPELIHCQERVIQNSNIRTHTSPFEYQLTLAGTRVSRESCRLCVFNLEHDHERVTDE